MTILTGILTADGDTEKFTYNPPAGRVEGFLFRFSDEIGGGTFVLRVKDPDGTFRDVTNGTFTTLQDKDVDLPKGSVVKATLTGSTNPNLRWKFQDIATG